MHLITMAHLGEAQGVIELFNLKRQNSQIFENEEICCLITGEGPFEAATATAHLLGKQGFTSVMNLGIAGSLSDELAVGEIYPVRSVYLVINERPQFKSFKAHEQGYDCLTSFERILDPEKALPLSGIAHLVDRESWGIALAAKNCGVPFSSFKLVSDLAGSLGACELSREMAQQWSQKLANKLKDLLSTETQIVAKALELPGFHFTFSTRHQFQQMLRKLGLREGLSDAEILSSLPVEQLQTEITNAKERTKLILELMEARLDPLKQKLLEGLENFKKPFAKQSITLHSDPTWESEEIRISFNVSTNEELKSKIEALKSLDLSAFQHLRNGNFHVE